MAVIIKLIIMLIFMICLGAAGIGLLIAEIVDAVKAQKVKKEGQFVYWYPF